MDQLADDDAIVVALGSSLAGVYGTRQALLDAAKDAFPTFGMRVRKSSQWWASRAWPDPQLPGFLNGVVLVDTDLTPEALMAALKALERRFGRERSLANAPRTLDLDLIAYGRRVIDETGLRVPHPRAHERRFVVGPLAEIAPDWRHPLSGRSAADLAATAGVGADARPI